jgi:hypothetical protein
MVERVYSAVYTCSGIFPTIHPTEDVLDWRNVDTRAIPVWGSHVELKGRLPQVDGRMNEEKAREKVIQGALERGANVVATMHKTRHSRGHYVLFKIPEEVLRGNRFSEYAL